MKIQNAFAGLIYYLAHVQVRLCLSISYKFFSFSMGYDKIYLFVAVMCIAWTELQLYFCYL